MFEAPSRERRARFARIEAPRRRRVHLSVAPTAYVHLEPEARREEPVAPAGRIRPTHRALARAETPAARIDERGRAFLVDAPTGYVRVRRPRDVEGVGASPVGHRRSRLAVSEPGTVLRPEVATEVASPTERLAARIRRRPVGRSPSPAEAPERSPRAEPGAVASRLPRRRRISVRDVTGEVVRRRDVRPGAAAYASARRTAAAPDAPSRALGAEARTPLARQARRIRRPLAHADASRDFRWLVPEEPREAPRPRRTRRVALGGTAPVRRDALRMVLREVSSVVRALEREIEARIVVPAARRVLSAGSVEVTAAAERLVTVAARFQRAVEAEVGGEAPGRRRDRPVSSGFVPHRRRPHGRGPSETLLAPEIAPVAAAEFRADRGLAHRWDRAVGGGPRGPEAGARRARDRSAAQGPAGRRTIGRWFAEPRATGRRFATLGSFEAVPLGAGEGGDRPPGVEGPGRPLRRVPLRRSFGATLGDLVAPERSVRGRKGRVPSRRRPRGAASATAMEPAVADPAWARRAMDGTAAPEGAWVGPDGEIVRPRSGGLFSALARASTPDDVVKVILERADGLRGIGKELPEPAVRLVERIVRIQDQVVAAPSVVGQDELEPLTPPRAPLSRVQGSAPTTTRRSRSVWSGSRTLPARRTDGAGASNMMKLASKLQKLIHLAEHERKLAEAQRYVRMAQEDGKVDSGKETAPGEAVEAPNLKALQREVFDAVLHEIDLVKQRRQEDFDVSVWW